MGSRITSLTDSDGTSDYTYDNTSQLVGADHSYQSDESYSFDENGNRTGGSYDTDDNNQLRTDGTYTYAYDAEGNRLTRTNISTSYVTEYQWDHRNRLTAVIEKDDEDNELSRVSFLYDLFDRRIAKSFDADGPGGDDSVVDRFVYDGIVPVLQFDGDGNLTHRYLNGPGIQPILADEAVTSLMSAGSLVWPLTDNLGTVRDLVDDSGTVLNHIQYDSFGNVTDETNDAVDFLFAFAGGIRDQETGLRYHRARYLDPSTGRFISEDPSGFSAGDSNLSRYVGNTTTILVDPSGLYEDDDGIADLAPNPMFPGQFALMFPGQFAPMSPGQFALQQMQMMNQSGPGIVFAQAGGKVAQGGKGDKGKGKSDYTEDMKAANDLMKKMFETVMNGLVKALEENKKLIEQNQLLKKEIEKLKLENEQLKEKGNCKTFLDL